MFTNQRFMCISYFSIHGICPVHLIPIDLNTLTLWSRSSSKCYLRIQSVPQREHNTSPLQRSTG
jgi:hypothetical protein